MLSVPHQHLHPRHQSWPPTCKIRTYEDLCFRKRTHHQLTHQQTGLPPVQMAICGTFSHPHRQSYPCRQSLGAFGRSVAEICRTLDLCSLTWTAAPCAQRPYLSSFHHYKGGGSTKI